MDRTEKLAQLFDFRVKTAVRIMKDGKTFVAGYYKLSDYKAIGTGWEMLTLIEKEEGTEMHFRSHESAFKAARYAVKNDKELWDFLTQLVYQNVSSDMAAWIRREEEKKS